MRSYVYLGGAALQDASESRGSTRTDLRAPLGQACVADLLALAYRVLQLPYMTRVCRLDEDGAAKAAQHPRGDRMTTEMAGDDRRLAITAPDGPDAIGPYSHAVVWRGVLYCSGSLPLDPKSGQLVDQSLAAETTQCLENLEAVCRAANTALEDAVRLTIYTTHLDGFGEINEAYGERFPAAPPARVVIGVAALPKGARVEIDAIVPAP